MAGTEFTAGTRFGQDFHDPRDAAQRLADKDGVRRQCTGLGRAAAQDAYRREVLAAVQVRRVQRSDRLSFHCCPGPEGRDVAVVTGELLMRSGAREDAALLAAMAPYGFDSTPIEELDGRVLRCRIQKSRSTSCMTSPGSSAPAGTRRRSITSPRWVRS
jgi:hypothetical protein